MKLPYIVAFERKEYVWNGKTWYGKSDYMTPALATISKLNILIDEELKAEDEKLFENFDSKVVMDAVQIAKTCNQKIRVERLLVRAYAHSKFVDRGVASMLSSFYREIGNPLKAIDVYAAFKGMPSSALQTTYAAALCDVARYEEALKHVRRALAIAHSSGSPAAEALSVYSRIKKESPILFEGPGKGVEGNVAVDIPGDGEKCPRCPGRLVKRRNQETGEYFLGCDHYPECKYSGSPLGGSTRGEVHGGDI